MVVTVAAVCLSLALLGGGFALAVSAAAVGAQIHFTAPEGVPALPALPALPDTRVDKARQVLDALASSEHLSVRAGSGYLRRQLSAAASCRAKRSSASVRDSSLGDGTGTPEEEGLRRVLVAVAGLSAVAGAPEGEDVSLAVQTVLAELDGEASRPSLGGAFQDRIGGSINATASGVW